MEVHILKKPSLKDPILLASWPGMGMLARMSADYLIQELNAKQFAEILYESSDIYFNNAIGETIQYKHRFYYVKRDQKNDLIICVGEIQPQVLSELHDLANQVLDTAKDFGVKRIFTIAALANPNDVKPRVFGVVNKPELKDFLNEYGVKPAKGDGRISGLNGLLIGIAKQKKIEGICLLCEIRYLDIPQPKSARTVLDTLTKILDIKVDMSKLTQQAEEIDEKIEQLKQKRIPEKFRPKEPRYIS
jgi:uncharacterized protein (TIGR00162 family)